MPSPRELHEDVTSVTRLCSARALLERRLMHVLSGARGKGRGVDGNARALSGSASMMGMSADTMAATSVLLMPPYLSFPIVSPLPYDRHTSTACSM